MFNISNGKGQLGTFSIPGRWFKNFAENLQGEVTKKVKFNVAYYQNPKFYWPK